MKPDVTPWPHDLYVLIPSYKAAASLDAFLPPLIQKVPADNICIVDDGSNDGTGDVSKRHKTLYVSHEVNKGKGAALQKGFLYLCKETDASWIITMDADGQHAVADLDIFLQAIARAKEKTGILIGKRRMKIGVMPLPRIFSNATTSGLLSLLAKAHIIDSQCGYRAYSRALVSLVRCRSPRFEMESEIILRAVAHGFSLSFVPVQTLYFSSQSHIAVFKDTVRWVCAVLSTFIELQRKKVYYVHTKT